MIWMYVHRVPAGLAAFHLGRRSPSRPRQDAHRPPGAGGAPPSGRALHIGPEGGLVRPAVRATPVGRERVKPSAGLGRPLSFVVNIVAAATDEAAPRRGQRRRVGFRGRFHLSRQRETVARRDKAAFPNDQIDAEILVAEGEAKRRRDVEIALAGRRIDVGRPAAPVLAVDRECRRRSARRGRSSRTPPRVWRRRYRCWRGSGAGRSGPATGRRGQRAGRVTLKRRFAWDFHAEAG